MCAVLLDVFFRYPMCELCIVQRLWMLVLAVVFSYGFLSCRWSSLRLFLHTGMLCLGWWGALQQYFIYVGSQSAFSCSLQAGPQYLPVAVYNRLAQWYHFVPCAAAQVRFLGLSFPAWLLVVYSLALLIYAFGCLCSSRRWHTWVYSLWLFYRRPSSLISREC